ncbi:accessory factor UbiK family protein [Ignatzschineria larvae DSM 13226]|uniref:Ubiquinone biosynthesis accessory factor UbiK n=1 Tax=Ignatzschineria larvae DSM 13226 TaxID=1111732 RepID=A0ABZ3C0L6_9GAMM|nr:accessory factor UbiK family protein [Ignatzschineria larvae]
MPKNFFQDLADKLQASLPDGVKNAQGEAERLVKEGVDSALSNFKLVRYDEFEIQQKVLLKTREKLEALTKRVEALEALLAATAVQSSDVVMIDESIKVIEAEDDSIAVTETVEVSIVTAEEASLVQNENIDQKLDEKSSETSNENPSENLSGKR